MNCNQTKQNNFMEMYFLMLHGLPSYGSRTLNCLGAHLHSPYKFPGKWRVLVSQSELEVRIGRNRAEMRLQEAGEDWNLSPSQEIWDSVGFFHQSLRCASCEALYLRWELAFHTKLKKGLLKLVFAAGVRLVQIWAGERRGIGRVREGSSIRNHQSTAMPHCIEGIPQIFHLLGTLKLWTCPPPKLLLAFTVAHFADGYIQSNLEDHKSLLYISIGFFSLGVKVMVLCFLVPQSAKWSQMFYTDTFWLNSK